MQPGHDRFLLKPNFEGEGVPTSLLIIKHLIMFRNQESN
jgi:hypothetical protein